MIKRQRKEFHIIGLCVIIVLLFLCVFNVTYSYFTAQASVNGTQSFYNLNIKFGYNDGSYNDVSGNTLVVTADKNTISRDEAFGLKVGDAAVRYLYFSVANGSCNSYVRYMLDAYKVDDLGNPISTVNYGQYFNIIPDSSAASNTISNRQIVTNNGVTNAVYYMYNALTSNINRFCDKIKLLDSAPVDMLDGNLKLTITFVAVQRDNEAFQSVFNDGWGYLNSWV